MCRTADSQMILKPRSPDRMPAEDSACTFTLAFGPHCAMVKKKRRADSTIGAGRQAARAPHDWHTA
jgi:hypothetical protein